MVTRETSYIGQLYFGLSTDDTADVAEWHNGDRILLMDIDEMYVFDEASFGFKQISMGGGGGGGGIQGLDILASGTYTLAVDSSASSLVIPVSLSDVQINGLFVSYTDSASAANNSTLGAFKSYNLAELFPTVTNNTFWTSFEGMCFKDSGGNIRYTGRTGSWTTGLTTDSLSAPTKITLVRQGSGQSFRAGDYYWEIRGKTL